MEPKNARLGKELQQRIQQLSIKEEIILDPKSAQELDAIWWKKQYFFLNGSHNEKNIIMKVKDEYENRFDDRYDYFAGYYI